eukprot:CAMPEP_0204897088 /NCGR_PEP_ID=MMETSP1397-20131031/538_1 /ASSEMBLY_ACC=CAM_ASM_000891 /TAXON_ID=49980 /ORGANISM="Climacostomum Climacostomum virens, Strain Stock W-24" /LENGTH=262 /DNA_ID=CAMNT_0052064793 /DNA_START=318 /DNA_END=1106 /DNA_ORIENTATION=+
MKMISFAHVISQALEERKAHHVAFKQFLYFIMAPTLCFQFEYPRSSKIRWIWLSKRIGEFVLGLLLMGVIVKQQMVPGIYSAIDLMEKENFSTLKLIDRYLKVSVPNLYVWLLLFYTVFQVALNIIAELIRFGDRTFYRDWWNAHTLAEYWRLWNAPVHNWLVRHVYAPMRNKGFSYNTALVSTFFVSALAHEYIGSGCFHTRSLSGFFAIMLQVPLISLTNVFEETLRESQLGNVFFWVSLCIVGQPIVLIIYSYTAIGQA